MEVFDEHASITLQGLFLTSLAQRIPNAHVPIIMLKISGILIDLFMARLTLDTGRPNITEVYSAIWKTGVLNQRRISWTSSSPE
jgi:poly(A) polymerase Pap1